MYTIQEIKEMPLEERLKVLEMRAKLQKKKAQVVGKVERIAKNGFNSFHKYDYSTESDIKEGVRKLLTEAGLTLDTEPIEEIKVEVNTKQGKAWLHTVKMEFILTDNDTGFMDIKVSTGEATDNGDKGIYKAYSGCIKYYLINNFLISTGEKDNDPESGESDQVFNNGGNKNNKNKNRGGNNNQQRNNNPAPPPQASRSSIEAKWKQLNNGTLEGLDEYIQKKQAEDKDLNWIDKILLGKIQAKQAEKKKQEQKEPDPDLTKDMEEAINSAPAETPEEPKETVTDVTTGNTVEYNGKNVTFE